MLAVPGILSTYFSSPVLMTPVILEVRSLLYTPLRSLSVIQDKAIIHYLAYIKITTQKNYLSFRLKFL